MAVPYILARTLKIAHAFAQEELGLSRGHYRIVNSPATLKSVRNTELHLVPGWQNRFDRFAMKGAIRYTRMTVIDHALDEDPAVPDELEPPGVQLAIVTDDEATAFVTQPDPFGESFEIQAEEPKKRRKSRCSDCGELHFRDEPCADPIPGT